MNKKPKTVETKEVIQRLEKSLLAMKKTRRKKLTAGQFFQILIDAQS